MWGQGCACAFSNVMCLKRRVPSVGKAENFPKINPGPEPPLHLPSCFEPWWAVRFKSSTQTCLDQTQCRPVMWKSGDEEPTLMG